MSSTLSPRWTCKCSRKCYRKFPSDVFLGYFPRLRRHLHLTNVSWFSKAQVIATFHANHFINGCVIILGEMVCDEFAAKIWNVPIACFQVAHRLALCNRYKYGWLSGSCFEQDRYKILTHALRNKKWRSNTFPIVRNAKQLTSDFPITSTDETETVFKAELQLDTDKTNKEIKVNVKQPNEVHVSKHDGTGPLLKFPESNMVAIFSGNQCPSEGLFPSSNRYYPSITNQDLFWKEASTTWWIKEEQET
jgi:hypothetical protein